MIVQPKDTPFRIAAIERGELPGTYDLVCHDSSGRYGEIILEATTWSHCKIAAHHAGIHLVNAMPHLT
jgi:hypothetical protein